MPIPVDLVLTTPRLRLRPLVPRDAPGLFGIFSDPAVTRYWSAPAWTRLEQARELIARVTAEQVEGRSVRLAVLAAEDQTLVGTFSVFSLVEESRRAEIGYALAGACWGRGFAQEAGRAVLGYAFDVLQLNRLEADIDPRNTASARVLDRLGFVREGMLRERWIVSGEVSDSAVYGLLRSDWALRPAGR